MADTVHECLALVQDFFAYWNLDELSKALQQCIESGTFEDAQDLAESLQNPPPDNFVSKDDILSAYDRCDSAQFLEFWHIGVPAEELDKDAAAQKLEFYAHVYAAIAPFLDWAPSEVSKDEHREQANARFQEFLSTRGADLSKTTEFLVYYALPHVPNPAKHPSFAELFTKEWSASLRDRLAAFLSNAVRAPAQPPRLCRLVYDRRDPGVKRQINPQDVNDADPLIRPNAYVHLVEAVTVAARVLRSAKHEAEAEQLEHALRESQPSAPTPGAGAAPVGDDLGPLYVPQKPAAPLSLSPIDFPKIKRDLGMDVPITQCLLLQALRWRVSQTPPGERRRRVLVQYRDADLLDLGPPGTATHEPHPDSLYAYLLRSKNPLVQEYALRFVNTLASETTGRQLLRQSGAVVVDLLEVLRGQENDTYTRQHALGTLQKLSLARSQQDAMITHGAIEWLLSILGDADALSEYSTEYASALLMNLSLRRAGKDRLAQHRDETFRALDNILETENFQVRSYANGILYSILSRRSFREDANAMGMPDRLALLLQHSDETLATQIRFILEKLQQDQTISTAKEESPHNTEDSVGDRIVDEDAEDTDDENGADDDADDQETHDLYDDWEEDEIETLPVPSNSLIGEDLLSIKYAYVLADAHKYSEFLNVIERTGSDLTRNSVDLRTAKQPLGRPITPRLSVQGGSGSGSVQYPLLSRPRIPRTPPGMSDSTEETPSSSWLHEEARERELDEKARAEFARIGALEGERRASMQPRDSAPARDERGTAPVQRTEAHEERANMPPPSRESFERMRQNVKMRDGQKERPITHEYYDAFATRSRLPRTPATSFG